MVRLTKNERRKQEEEAYEIEKEKELNEFPWNFINLLLQFEKENVRYTLRQDKKTNDVLITVTNEEYEYTQDFIFPLDDIKNHTISNNDYRTLIRSLSTLYHIVEYSVNKKQEELRLKNLRIQALSKLTDDEKLALNLK
jgi:hypothetical protein